MAINDNESKELEEADNDEKLALITRKFWKFMKRKRQGLKK